MTWRTIDCEPIGKVRGRNVYSPEDRILRQSMPEPNSGCWIWLGTTRQSPCGIEYGRLTVGSRTDKTRRQMSAHRLSYETFKGEVPEGLHVCHSCDNGLCVNPDHLWVGTHSDNMKDAVRKGRVIVPRKPAPPEEE